MEVILCTEDGTAIGTEEIFAAHAKNGMLHQAFSIFLFTPDRKSLLIQKRASTKPLFALQWGNSCCSHPRPEKSLLESAHQRLHEELGIDTELEEVGSFVYQAKDPHGNGSEYEHDTVLIGTIDEDAIIDANPEEIDQWKWIDIATLKQDFIEKPDIYCPWFPLAFAQLPSQYCG